MIIKYLTCIDKEINNLSFNEERINDLNFIKDIVIEKSVKHIKIFQNNPLALCYFCYILLELVEYLQI